MFEGSLVESTPLLRSRSRKPLYTSVAIQAALAAALIMIPLLHPEIIPVHPPTLILTAPIIPKATPPPPPTVHVEATTAPSTPQPAAYAPPRINVNTFSSLSDAINSNDAPIGAVSLSNMGTSGIPTGVLNGDPTSHVSISPAPKANTGPLRISQGISAGLLLSPILPIYPPIAKMTHTQGVVVVQAVITTTGHIESAHAVSGPVMLQGAALDAVRAAHYRPFLLSGQPTAVETTITINFHMDS